MEDIIRVEALIDLNSELLKTTKNKIAALEKKRKLNEDKLLGLKFSTQDRNQVFAEQVKDLEEKKEELSSSQKARILLSSEVSLFFSIVVQFCIARSLVFFYIGEIIFRIVSDFTISLCVSGSF